MAIRRYENSFGCWTSFMVCKVQPPRLRHNMCSDISFLLLIACSLLLPRFTSLTSDSVSKKLGKILKLMRSQKSALKDFRNSFDDMESNFENEFDILNEKNSKIMSIQRLQKKKRASAQKSLKSDLKSLRSQLIKMASDSESLKSDVKQLQTALKDVKKVLEVNFNPHYCPKPWEKWYDMCLMGIKKFMDKGKAVKKCRDANGHLVWIESDDEFNNIDEYVLHQAHIKSDFFLGLHVVNYKLKWVTGPPTNKYNHFNYVSFPANGEDVCMKGNTLKDAHQNTCMVVCRRF